MSASVTCCGPCRLVLLLVAAYDGQVRITLGREAGSGMMTASVDPAESDAL